MTYKYFQVEQIESQKSIEKFNKSVDELYKIFEKKIELEKDLDLEKYFSCIKNKATTNHITYLNLIQEDVSFLKAKSSEITKIMNLFIRRMTNEIENADIKSTEISLNILNETHSRVNKNIRKIEKSYDSFQSLRNLETNKDEYIYIVDLPKEGRHEEKDRSNSINKSNTYVIQH